MAKDIIALLGDDGDFLLGHQCKTISKEKIHLPGPDFIDRVLSHSDRSITVLRNLQSLYNHGRLQGTGYLSILPVDQGIEHSAGASFAPNPIYFDPENLVKLAIEGGCNAVASTLGALGSVARRYAHKIPFITKLNHNEFLSYPNSYDQILFAQVDQAFEMGAVGVGATIYFGGFGDDSLGLPEKFQFQGGGDGLSRRRRPDGAGQSPGRHHRGRHREAKTSGEQRRLQSA